jgi:mevalonate kinase
MNLCTEAGATSNGTLTITHHLPLGKGMGSGTALVIAIAKCLLGDDCKERALAIEDVVDPGHSGIDFQTIWDGHPILFKKGSPTVQAAISAEFLKEGVLIDTGAPGETTAELVAWMKTREAEMRPFFETIGACTERLMGGESPITVIPDHHRAQIGLGIVPDSAKHLIERIEHEGGVGKVIGAGGRVGGGGMVLALHPEKKQLLSMIPADFTVYHL